MEKTEKLSSIVYRKFSKGKPYRSIEKTKDANDTESPSQERVARIVDQMVRKLGHPESVMFYRKCAWHMSEDEIFSRIESAQGPKIVNPHAFFIWSANKLLKKRS